MANTAKSYFAMHRGLNTEAPMINFPDGYTIEEQNYELTIKGERRRRLGIGLETGGSTLDISDYSQGDAVRVFDWENVAGIPTINFEVMQVGYIVYIFDDANPTSTTRLSTYIDIRSHRVPNATDAQISQHPLESAFGRGHLFLFGKYTAPIYIEYDPETTTFIVTQIQLRERDFQGIDDGYSFVSKPTVNLDSHRYNLRNRGWTDALIDAYYLDQANYPSKAMIPWLGLKRALTAGNSYDDDGIRAFDPAKLAAEYFQDASAPQGHQIINPFDTTTYDDNANHLVITTWTITPPTQNGVETVTITTDGNHGLAVTDMAQIDGLSGSFITWEDPFGSSILVEWFNIDGQYEVIAVPAANQFEIQITFPNYPFVDWYNQYTSLGTFVGGQLPTPSGDVVDFRPKAGAFFAGRAWYAGIDTSRLTGRIYFSQVIESEAQYGKCYQIADPTDERISDLVASDGGVIVIPEAANVIKLLPFNSSLLVFASNGVWEIGPGDLGYFAATSYSVRKITDSGAVSPGSVVLLENLPVYWGVTDIYGISPDERTGYLQVRNISERLINKFYNDIPLANRRQCVGVYDDLSKRVIWLYASNATINSQTYDSALVFDSRLSAFVPFRFAYETTGFLTSVFVLKEAEEVSKVKYVAVVNDELYIGEANNYTDYKDFGLSEPECYMITGYDSLNDPSSQKQAPLVWVFSRKTETGYDVSLNAIRPSSTLMQARWEWADNASAGKWGTEQEVYRHQRPYVPVDTDDGFDDGTPVVVTRNKLRGKGRVLQLKFTAGQGKDSHLMGWKTNFIRMDD